MTRAGARGLLVFPALAIALFPRAFLGLGTFFHYDVWMQNLAFRAWWFEQLRAGHFATWCSGMFCGYPLFAETQTGPLYPPTFVLFSLLPATLAFSWSVVLHFALAGAGAYVLARRLGAGVAGALVAGVAFELSGFLVTHVVHFNLLTGAAWAPWALFFARGAWDGRHGDACLLAAVVGLLLLGAHPYATLMTLLAVGLALVVFRAGAPAAAGRALLVTAAATIVGAGIAAVQVLPARAFLEQTTRGTPSDLSFLTFGSFPPWSLGTLVVPDLFGTPVDGSWWGGPDWSHYAETCAYVGIVPIVLAVAALALRRDRATLFGACLAAVAFVLMLGKYTPVYQALGWVPLWQSTRLPARFALLLTLALSLLAGLGLDALLRERDASRRRRALLLGGAAVVALVGAALAAGAASLAPDPALASTGRAWAGKIALVTANARSAMLHLALAVGLAIVSFAALVRRGLPPARAGWAPVAALVVDLFVQGAGFNPLLKPSELTDPPPVLGRLPETAPRPRVFRQGVDEIWNRRPGAPRVDLYTSAWKGREADYASGAWALPPNSQLLYGIDSGEGFTSLLPLQWLDWMGLPSAPGAVPRPDLTDAQADLLALDAVLSTGAGIAGEGWTATSLPGDVFVSLNVDPLPRVRLARSWETMPDRARLLATVRDAAHDPRERVLLEVAPPGLPSRSGEGRVDEPLAAVEVGPGRWTIETPARSNGLVVVAESFAPGWRATSATGDELPVVRADGLFVAFPAPPGGGPVTLRYRAPGLGVGGAVTIVSVVALLALVPWARRRPGRERVSAPALVPGIAIVGPLVVAALVATGSWWGDAGGGHADRAASTLDAAAVRSWADEAFAAYTAGALEPAASLLRAAIERTPADASLHFRAALVARAAGQLAEARASFRRALELDPALSAAREALAVLENGAEVPQAPGTP